MLSQLGSYLVAFAPAAGWQVVTFFLSGSIGSFRNTLLALRALNSVLSLGLDESTLIALNAVWRKVAHLLLYMVFALLLLRGFRSLPPTAWKPAGWNLWAWVLALVFGFATFDEFHQSLVVERSGRAADVLLDSFGGAAGLAVVWLHGRRRGRPVLPPSDDPAAGPFPGVPN